MEDAQKSPTVSMRIQQIAEQASSYPEMMFTSLAHLIDVELLTEVFSRTTKSDAAGIDRVTAEEYAQDLEGNLLDFTSWSCLAGNWSSVIFHRSTRLRRIWNLASGSSTIKMKIILFPWPCNVIYHWKHVR